MISKPATNIDGGWIPVAQPSTNSNMLSILNESQKHPIAIDEKIHWITTSVNSRGGLNVKQIAEYPYVTTLCYGLNLTPFIVHLKTQNDLDNFMARLDKADNEHNFLFNIRSIDLTGGIFTSMKSVLEIFNDTVIFAKNRLMVLELDSIAIYRKLDVSYNQLNTVKLTNCQIEELNLSHNNITSITFADCTICKLNLSYNKLKTFDWKHLPDEIKEIRITHNLLDIGDIFGVTAETIDVSSNATNKYPIICNCVIGSFSANRCGIETILFPNTLIGILSLYENNIKSFPTPNSDETPIGLSSLDLSSNQFEGDLYLTRFTLSYLDIGFNKITSICLSQCSFYYFIANRNKIVMPEFSQTGIVFLDLSGNNIGKMLETFPRDVEVLILSNNHIVNFFVTNPIYKTIRKLDLSNNDLRHIVWNYNWLNNVTDLQLDRNPNLMVSKICFRKVFDYLSVSKTKDNSTEEIEHLKTFAKRVDFEWSGTEGNESVDYRINYINHPDDESSPYFHEMLDKEKASAILTTSAERSAETNASNNNKQPITLDIDDRDFDDDTKLRMQTIKNAKENATGVPSGNDDDENPPKLVEIGNDEPTWNLTNFWKTNYHTSLPAIPVKTFSKAIPVTTRWTYET
jgi:hypothetical protein